MGYKLLTITLTVLCLIFLIACAATNRSSNMRVSNYGKNLIPFVEFNPENEQVWGYLDEDTGEIVIEAKYAIAAPFVGNFASVYDRSRDIPRTFIINKNGKVISTPSFHNVYFIISESGNNTLAILERELQRTKFQIGISMLGVTTKTGFYKEKYWKYRLVNLVTGKTIIPQKENYLSQRIEIAGDYFILSGSNRQIARSVTKHPKIIQFDNPARR